MADESAADDGAIYAFWDFIRAVRARRRPPAYAHQLDDARRLRDAVAAFELERDDP